MTALPGRTAGSRSRDCQLKDKPVVLRAAHSRSRCMPHDACVAGPKSGCWFEQFLHSHVDLERNWKGLPA